VEYWLLLGDLDTTRHPAGAVVLLPAKANGNKAKKMEGMTSILYKRTIRRGYRMNGPKGLNES
jgi:hypothetical protein